MFKSRYGDKGEISKVIYWFQIFNYAYILVYLLFAIIDTFIWKSLLLFNIDFYSVIIYSELAIILLFIISIISIISP